MYAITFVYIAAGEVSVPRLSELAAAHRLDEAQALWHKMVSANALVTFPLVAYALVLAPQIIIVLFTNRYLASTTVWRINLLLLCVQMTGYGYVPRAFARTRGIMIGNVARLVVGLPITYLLVWRWGLVGGASGSVIGFTINAVVQLRTGRQALGASIRRFMPWTCIAHVLLVSGACGIPLFYISQSNLSSLMVLSAGAALYFPLVVVLLVFSGFFKAAGLGSLRESLALLIRR
jgi:O-antigen/teichoic acid export membrane protein